MLDLKPNKSDSSSSSVNPPRTSRFLGRTEEIKHDIFDVPDGRSPEQFNKTLEAIADYILKEYRNGMTCSQSIRDMSLAHLDEPERPKDFNDPVQMAIFNEEVREYVKEKKTLKGQLNSAFGLIWRQCTPGMKCAVESSKDHDALRKMEILFHCLRP
jgi:hypothetical protein